MKCSYIVILILLVGSTHVFGQEKVKTKEFNSGFSFGGQFMLSTDFNNIFYNMGGGGIAVTNSNVSISLNFLPSLRYNFDAEKLTPTLGHWASSSHPRSMDYWHACLLHR